MPEPRPPWWRGTRGEWYVVAQLALIALVFFGPQTLPNLPAWPASVARISRYAGGALALAGLSLLLAGLLRLGYATVLLIFLDIKSAREERWLAEKFPDYPDYRRRVRKLIPFVY